MVTRHSRKCGSDFEAMFILHFSFVSGLLVESFSGFKGFWRQKIRMVFFVLSVPPWSANDVTNTVNWLSKLFDLQFLGWRQVIGSLRLVGDVVPPKHLSIIF